MGIQLKKEPNADIWPFFNWNRKNTFTGISMEFTRTELWRKESEKIPKEAIKPAVFATEQGGKRGAVGGAGIICDVDGSMIMPTLRLRSCPPNTLQAVFWRQEFVFISIEGYRPSVYQAGNTVAVDSMVASRFNILYCLARDDEEDPTTTLYSGSTVNPNELLKDESFMRTFGAYKTAIEAAITKASTPNCIEAMYAMKSMQKSPAELKPSVEDKRTEIQAQK